MARLKCSSLTGMIFVLVMLNGILKHTKDKRIILYSDHLQTFFFFCKIRRRIENRNHLSLKVAFLKVLDYLLYSTFLF